MTDVPFNEGVLYARHPPIRGSVLIVGAGAVGGSLAEQLSRLGMTITLVDHDSLDPENIIRHELGASSVGLPKASSLASRLEAERPGCKARGIDKNFMEIPRQEQLRLVGGADVVVAAADDIRCQREVNQVCLEASATAVFPSFWVDPQTGTREAEIGEIFWYRPGNQMPCYSCLTWWRPEETGAAARGGTSADIQLVALATVWVVAALVNPASERSRILDEERPLILIHGFMPHQSDNLRAMFNDADDSGFLCVEVPFPRAACSACHRWAEEPPPPINLMGRAYVRPRELADDMARRWDLARTFMTSQHIENLSRWLVQHDPALTLEPILDRFRQGVPNPDWLVAATITATAPDKPPEFRGGVAVDRQSIIDLTADAIRGSRAGQGAIRQLRRSGALSAYSPLPSCEGYDQIDVLWRRNVSALASWVKNWPQLKSVVENPGTEARLLLTIADETAREELATAASIVNTESARSRRWFRELVQDTPGASFKTRSPDPEDLQCGHSA